MPWFIVTGILDVFYNGFCYYLWFRLGNLGVESLEHVLRRYERNDTPGLRMVFGMPPQELVGRYRDTDSAKAFHGANDLLALYVARHLTRGAR